MLRPFASPNNVGSCWPTILRLFARGFSHWHSYYRLFSLLIIHINFCPIYLALYVARKVSLNFLFWGTWFGLAFRFVLSLLKSNNTGFHGSFCLLNCVFQLLLQTFTTIEAITNVKTAREWLLNKLKDISYFISVACCCCARKTNHKNAQISTCTVDQKHYYQNVVSPLSKI